MSAGTFEQDDGYYVTFQHSGATGSADSKFKCSNPGSKFHPDGCKPCNKFNPARPTDSCKHGDSCDFCHEDHERPKHRGQRGRHALQRRQYLLARQDQPQFFVDLVDKIYEVPHKAVDEIKRKLVPLSSQEREAKVKLLLPVIRNIGMEAQSSRPDSSRLRGADPVDGSVANIAELDGRCKWLVGTLHLMVRKMFESNEPQDKITDVVDRVLEECRQLPKYLDDPDSIPWVRLHPRFQSVAHTVSILLRSCDEDQIAAIQQDFEDMANHTESMNETERADLEACFKESSSIEDLKDRLNIQNNEVVKKFGVRRMDQLYSAEMLEDLGTGTEVPKYEFKVRWRGGIIGIVITQLDGQPTAGSVRKRVQEQFNQWLQDRGVKLFRIAEDQVKLGVKGLPVELDYNRPVPEAAKCNLTASASVSMDDSQCHHMVALYRQEMPEAGGEEIKPSDAVKGFQEKLSVTVGDLKIIHHLLGSRSPRAKEATTAVSEEIATALDSINQTIDAKTNMLINEAMAAGYHLGKVRGITDEIEYARQMLRSSFEMESWCGADLKTKMKQAEAELSSSSVSSVDTLENLLQKLTAYVS